jgi:hypothetical protein
MKMLLLIAFLALSAHAASLTVSMPLKWVVHPVASFHSSRKSLDGMLITDTILQMINVGDYATTRRGAFPGTGGCELNPLLISAPCQIDVPRFTGVKIAVAAAGLAEWIPVWLGKSTPNYVFTITVVNAGLAVPLGIAVGSNIHQLTK